MPYTKKHSALSKFLANTLPIRNIDDVYCGVKKSGEIEVQVESAIMLPVCRTDYILGRIGMLLTHIFFYKVSCGRYIRVVQNSSSRHRVRPRQESFHLSGAPVEFVITKNINTSTMRSLAQLCTNPSRCSPQH